MTSVNVAANYEAFIAAKSTPGVRFHKDGTATIPAPVDASDGHEAITQAAPHLHEYQAFCAAFALSRKRAALFLECGLGKTSVSLAWARSIGGASVVCAPLAACYEYIDEAERFFDGLEVTLLRGPAIDAWLANPSGVGLMTHHAMLRERDLSRCRALVIDEASILKSIVGGIALGMKAAAQSVEYRLLLSATPAPNDPTEYGAQATLLGYVKTEAEFRTRFFVRDGSDWRIKRHAVQEMPRWLSSWAIWMRDPAVYGMACAAAVPEPFNVEFKHLGTTGVAAVDRDLLGRPVNRMNMSQRATLRKSLWSDSLRTAAVVSEVSQGGPSIVWGMSNAHCDTLEKAIRSAGVAVAQLAGTTGEDDRVAILRRYRAGELDCIVSKPRIIGHGVNLQRADVMVWAGYDESYEAKHQSIRRAHRQGRTGALRVVYMVTDDEQRIIDTLSAKGHKWDALATQQEREMQKILSAEVKTFRSGGGVDRAPALPMVKSPVVEREWFTMHHGDCVQVMRDSMTDESVDLAVFSPPFSSLFTFSSEAEDMSNCSEHDADTEFGIHFRHFAGQLVRVMKPGRVVCMHMQQLVAFRSRHGRKGIRDLRGALVAAMEDEGFLFYGEFVIAKNPEAAAIRTKSERLIFAQMQRDSLESSPCFNDYVLQFRKPGKQVDKVKNDLTRAEWIAWASGVWTDIRESDVLTGYKAARGDADEKHISPLQLEVIRRCVRLWSNKGEDVFSPFAGIGSELFVAIEQGRRGVGIELKPEYFAQAVSNCGWSVERTHQQGSLL